MDDPWYKKGLRFACTECGACCTGSPGYVWLEEKDIQAICEQLQISREDLLKRYCRQIGHRFALKEHSKTYDCVFLRDNRCTIYSARPEQCRSFPWWVENLTSPQAWKEAAERCEGIGHPEGKLYSLSEIQSQLNSEPE
jgi:Fe-S-cluster containining protein